MAKAGQLREAVALFSEAVAAMPSNKVVNLNAARVMILDMRERVLRESSWDRCGNCWIG